MTVKFFAKQDDVRAVFQIAERAVALADKFGMKANVRDIAMDISATHNNGCKLRIGDLLEADDTNFAHDVFGIGRHLDRKTGKLMNCFVPRYAVPAAQTAEVL